MKPLNPKISLAVLALLSCMLTFGGELDNNSWNNLRIRKELGDKFRSELRVEHRLDNNFTTTNQFFGEFSTLYKLMPFLNFNLGYRYIVSKNDVEYDGDHRFLLDAVLKQKFRQSKLDMRLRLQSQVEDFAGAILDPENCFRSRLRFQQSIPALHLAPYTMAESWLQVEPNSDPFTRMRYTLGTYIYPNMDAVYFQLYYHLEKRINNPRAVNSNVYGVAVYFNI